MPKNSHFTFKQFEVAQDQCAMKVSTDACIFGAWVAAQLNNRTGIALDIGAGTGLLALMIAQQAPQLQIHAVEMDAAAARQAAENAARSPFHSQIEVFAQTVQEFMNRQRRIYDFIFSNPPFFNRSLQSPQEQRNAARHTVTLQHKELIAIAAAGVLQEGYFFVLLPADLAAGFTLQAAKCALLLHELQLWAAREGQKPHIALLKFGKLPAVHLQQANNFIYLPDGTYSPAMRELLADYYLYL